MSKRIAFFDIDGTLADNRKLDEPDVFLRIPDSAKRALKQLKANGIEPVLATGRSFGMVEELMEQLEMDSVVSSNGGVVVYKGEVLCASFLPVEEVDRICKLLLTSGKKFLIETKDVIYQLKQAPQTLGDGSFHIVTWEEEGYPEDIIQIVVVETTEKPKELDNERIEAVKVGFYEFDVKLKNVSKASGIRQMLEKSGLKPEESIGFGDEENDLPMFEAVGFTVALGNGNPTLKAKADYVTDDVVDDGIWNACKHFEWI